MTINLLDLIGDDKAAKNGGYSGAVFLTYSLNLIFFEQIILPALNRSGCANSTIIADPDGYFSSMEQGKENIKDAGLRYVCSPITRPGSGIQHAKILLMAGPQHGKLFIGSGNLSHHGFGRNLELFTRYEHSPDKNDDVYVFNQVWDLLEKIQMNRTISGMARDQIETIAEKAEWLKEVSELPDNFRIWHNYDSSIWEQLSDWRDSSRFSGVKLRSLIIISPYYDQKGATIRFLVDELKPREVQIFFNKDSTNLNGADLLDFWDEESIAAYHIEARSKEKSRGIRKLHAKAIIGIAENGSWCLSGSTNISYRALRSSWSNGGNLELVTMQWSDEPSAFDYLLDDEEISYRKVNLEDVKGESEDPSEVINRELPTLNFNDLRYEDRCVYGSISESFEKSSSAGKLLLLKKQSEFDVEIDKSGDFILEIDFELAESEAAKLQVGDKSTGFQWIDQPERLEHYGARSYYSRVKGKIESFDGAKSLSIELMDFLWDRVDLEYYQREEGERKTPQTRRRQSDSYESEREEDEAPPIDRFFTEEEAVRDIKWGVDQQEPYQRDLMSFRDLLSIVLIRLTTETRELPDGTDIKDEESEDEDGEREQKRINILDSLRNYLLRYVKKYSKKLVDVDFVLTAGPRALFQNQFTLGRVIIEFNEKVDLFIQKDLKQCYWYMWAPFAKPEMIGLEGGSVLGSFMDLDSKMTLEYWDRNQMSSLLVIMTALAFGDPPHWKVGLYNEKKVMNFLHLRNLIGKMIDLLGIQNVGIKTEVLEDVFGISSVRDIRYSIPVASDEMAKELNQLFYEIYHYIPPARERLEPLFDYHRRINEMDEESKNEYQKRIIEAGLEEEFEIYKNFKCDFFVIVNGDEYCPRCGGGLKVAELNKLKRGGLVPCPHCRNALIYQIPALPDKVM